MTSKMPGTAHRIRIPFVSQQVEDHLLWRDPKRTGIAVGAATAVLLFFAFLRMPLISLVLYTAGSAVLLCTLWSRFGKTVGKPMPELPPYLREGLSESDYKAYADRIKPHVDKALSMLNSLIVCRDLALNIKLCAILFVAGKVLAYMSPISIALLCMVIAFTVPKIYEMHKDKIDEQIVKARDQTVKGYERAKGEMNKVVDKSPALQNARARLSSATKKKA